MKNLTPKLFNKYHVPTPRYTSYPAYPHWNNLSSEREWIENIQINYEPSEGIDLYIHIPYCFKPCFYCGCNKIVTKDRKVENRLIENIIKEFQLYVKNIENIKIASLHLGGGTPNFLSSKAMAHLFYILSDYFKENIELSIEVDPRSLEDNQIDLLKNYGFKNVSLGIQDFSPIVQKAINRIQSFELVKSCVGKLRDIGIESINFDLIYGLPYQTNETIQETIEDVIQLAPDSIAFFSYAHLPNRFPLQKRFERTPLPQGEEKYNLFLLGREYLLEKGYEAIGLDHFAKSGNRLLKAYKNKKLKRNFMGYTLQKSHILLGLGPSAISNSSDMFKQNNKDLVNYYEDIEENSFSMSASHIMEFEEYYISNAIEEIMCHGSTNIKDLINKIPPNKMSFVRNNIQNIISDGLVELRNGHLQVTKLGTHYLRNICKAIDTHFMKEQTTRFSKAH